MVLTPVLRYDTSTALEYTVLLYGTCIRTLPVRRILFELQYGTSTLQPYKYRQEKGPKYSTVRYRNLVNVHKSTVLVRKGVRYATRRVPPRRSMKNGVLVQYEYMAGRAAAVSNKKSYSTGPIVFPKACLVRCHRFFVYYIVFRTAMKICVSSCYADLFFLIVQITAYLTCAGFCSAGTVTRFGRAETYSVPRVVRLLGIVLVDISQYGS